jgi:hypothetical protein
MTAKYKARVAFDRDNGEEVTKGKVIELQDQEADAYIDAGWIELVEEAPGEKPDETAPPVPSQPDE